MKTNKRILFIALVALCLSFVTACSSPDNNSKDEDIKDVSNDGKGKFKVEVEEEVLFDQEGIKVTLKSIDEEGWIGTSLKVLVENNSEQSITIQARDSSINGVMVSTLFSCDVEPNKKANDEITFMESDIEKADISVIKDIELKLHIFDSNTWDEIIDSESILINTNADKGYVQLYDDSGQVVLDEKDIKIVMKRVDSEDSFWGADIHVYIENNSAIDMSVQARDVSINGFMIDPIFSSDVLSGKKAYDTITFLDVDLEDNDIINIDEMELSFHIFNMESWDTIFDSDKISVTFE